MYELYKIRTRVPCNILGCEHTDAVLIVRTDDGHGDYAVCPECVQNMSDMNDTNADFFAQEPLPGRVDLSLGS
jgi:hypothetical protein